MFEDIRRGLAHRREAKEKERLKKIEVERRLSYIKMKRLEERKSAEAGLTEQVGAERTAQTSAAEALGERKQMEKELRVARGPGTGMKVVRGIGRGTKAVFHDAPVKIVRVSKKLSKGGGFQRIVIGDTQLILGIRKPTTGTKQPTQSVHELIFGPPTKTSEKPKDIGKDILS